MYKEQSNEKRTHTKNLVWKIFIQKIIGRAFKTFIPLGGETINFSLVERFSLLTDPQPDPLLHFLVQMKSTFTMLSFKGPKM